MWMSRGTVACFDLPACVLRWKPPATVRMVIADRSCCGRSRSLRASTWL